MLRRDQYPIRIGGIAVGVFAVLAKDGDAILGRPENPTNFDPPGAVLEANGYKILGTLTDQFDHAKGKANAEDTLAKYPDIGCLVGLFAYNAVG